MLPSSLAAVFVACVYPVYDEKTAAIVDEQQSVWQYLKIFSIYDRLPAKCGAMTPYDMFRAINDSLGSGRYTEYIDDRPGGGFFFDPEIVFDDTLELTPSTAYIRIPEFSNPAKDFFSLSQRFMSRYQNIIIDLRFNGGGLLSATDYMLGELLPRGTEYIGIRQRSYNDQTFSGETVEAKLKTGNAYPALLNKNITVLMNGYSASASEIMAAALKDRAGAYLVGETSYGKGIGQVIIGRNRRKTLSITFMEIRGLTERTGDYHRVGIAPDDIPEEAYDEVIEFLISDNPLSDIAIAQSMNVLEEICGECSYMSPVVYLSWVTALSIEMLCGVKLLDPDFMVVPESGGEGDDDDGDADTTNGVAAKLRKFAARKNLPSKAELREIVKNGMPEIAVQMRRPMGAVIVGEEELLKKHPQLLRMGD
ncbi:MAG: S41 family peptidase [Chitinispirillales bacterium]|nr:S41 family peptidase [Chitinispirillales bacterium]